MDRLARLHRRAAFTGCLLLLGCGSDEVVIDRSTVEIAFVRIHDDGSSQLRAFSPGSSDVALLPPEPPGIALRDPCWSADGRLLAYQRENGEDPPEIHVLDPRTGTSRLLAEGVRPAWSPVGHQLGLLRAQSNELALFVIEVDTEVEQRVGAGYVRDFGWAPDGERLVVVGRWPELDSSIALYVVDLDTGDASRIDPDPPDGSNLPSDSEPRWSADGSTIAFISVGRSTEGVYSAMYRVDPDGGGFAELPTVGAHGVREPTWSPVGRQLAYEYWQFDAVEPTDVGVGLGSTRRYEAARGLAWSPDGSAVALVQTPLQGSSRPQIMVVSLDDDAWVPPLDGEDPGWSDLDPAWRRLPVELQSARLELVELLDQVDDLR